MYNIEQIHNFENEIQTISFGPSTYSIQDIEQAQTDPGLPPLRFVTTILGYSHVYECIRDGDDWTSDFIGNHLDQCTTAAWSSNIGSHEDIIASGGKDNKVHIWSKELLRDKWELRTTIDVQEKVIGLSWNQTGKFTICEP